MYTHAYGYLLIHICSLPCSPDSFALLAGYIVQGEFGDIEVNDPSYLEEVPFLESVVSYKRINHQPVISSSHHSQVRSMHK